MNEGLDALMSRLRRTRSALVAPCGESGRSERFAHDSSTPSTIRPQGCAKENCALN